MKYPKTIIFSLVLVILLAFSTAEALEMGKIKYFVGQEIGAHPSGDVVSFPFSFELKEDLDDTEKFKSVIFVIRGISSPSASVTIDVSIDQIAQDPTLSPRLKTYSISTLGKGRFFRIFYDATSYFNSIPGIEDPGTFPFVLNLKHSGSTIYLWQAKLIAVFVKAPKYKAKGNVVSVVFDTQTADGAAFNSLVWKGSKSNGRVRIQIATSDCSNGAANSPTCDTGTWQFVGSDCTIGTYYEPDPDTPIEIGCASSHNNKRYFKYKVELCSKNCIKKGRSTPRVDDVVVNWSP